MIVFEMGIFSQWVLCRSWRVLILQGGQTQISLSFRFLWSKGTGNFEFTSLKALHESIQTLHNGKSQCQLMYHAGKNVEIIPIKKGWFQAKERRLQPWAEVWTIIYPIQVMRSVMDITIYSKTAFTVVGWNRRCLVVLPQDFFVGGHNMTVWCWSELSPKAKWLALKSDELCHFCQISAEPEDDLDLPVGAATWLHKIYQNIMCFLKAKQYGKTHSIGILFGHPKGSPTMAAF